MKNTKIYTVLVRFNKYELNKLRKFLLSPYFNSDKTIIALFDILSKYIRSSQKKELTKTKVWKELTKSPTYDDVRFRKYCSDLLKVVESFLAYDLVENNPIKKSTLILEAIKNRKIESLYNTFIKQSKKLTENDPNKSSSSHLNKYLIEKSLYELTNSELKRLDKSNIESISQTLDNFYFSEKLKFYSSALSQKSYISEEYKIAFMDDLLKIIEKSTLKSTPSISIYYYCLLTVIEVEDINHYYKLKELLSINASNFPKNEALSLYYFAANYCIRKHNAGNHEFIDELFQLYSEMVEKEIILSDNNEISPWDFKNIVATGLFMKKFNWTEAFINDFGDKIPKQYRKNSIRFNLGQLYFAQKKYNDVLEQLRDLEYDDVLASLNAKTFATITYYELDEIDLLFSYIESFRVYLGRKTKKKELNKARQQRYLRFLNLVKRLTKIIPGDRKVIEKIENDLNKEKKLGLIGAKWLTEKIADLK